MEHREKSIYSVVDIVDEQNNHPLPYWGQTVLELWNEKAGTKYGRDSFSFLEKESTSNTMYLYRLVNYYSIDNFKKEFLKEFETYKGEEPDGTIETFKNEYYKQFIYECGDVLELIQGNEWVYLENKNGFDFYIKDGNYNTKTGYVLTRKTHSHEININALLQFLEVDCMIEAKRKSTTSKDNLKPKKHSFDSTLSINQIKYLYTSYFSKRFICTIEDIEKLFSEDINTKITINEKITIVEIVYFFSELKNNGFIRSTYWKDAIVKTKCILFKNIPLISSNFTNALDSIRKIKYSQKTIDLVEKVILEMPK